MYFKHYKHSRLKVTYKPSTEFCSRIYYTVVIWAVSFCTTLSEYNYKVIIVMDLAKYYGLNVVYSFEIQRTGTLVQTLLKTVNR